MYVGHIGECRHFYVEDGVVRHETIDVLGCNHAEEDTRICLHAKVTDYVGNANNIIIIASDTVITAINIGRSPTRSFTDSNNNEQNSNEIIHT